MLFSPKVILFTVLLIAGIITCALLYASWANKNTEKFRQIAHQALGKAVRTKTKKRRRETKDGRGEVDFDIEYSTIVTYEYQVDGITYKIKREFKDRYPAEHSFYYHPQKPQKAFWSCSDINHQTRHKVISVIITFILIIVVGNIYRLLLR